MTSEIIKRMFDACYQAKRTRDMLPPLPEGVRASFIQYLDVIQSLERKGIQVKDVYKRQEYMHDMGNSLGGMESYIRLLDQYEDYQGGFIWDYIDQALFVKDEVTGRDVLRYGGDFDDRPSDYEFSGNGILFADRTEKPAMQEVRHYYGLRR